MKISALHERDKHSMYTIIMGGFWTWSTEEGEIDRREKV